MTPRAPFLVRLEWDEELRELAAAEARALGAGEELARGLLWSATPPDPRASLLLGGGEVIAWGPPGGPLEPCLKEEVTHLYLPRGPWLTSRNPLVYMGELGWRVRHAVRGAPYELYPTPQGWYLVRGVGALRFRDPRVPHRYSTSLPPRLARAVVNLVARPGDRVVDPVCGAGVMLVEAARIGCTVRGSDLNKKASWHARVNLGALGLAFEEVVQRDALALGALEADALVGDLPYGRMLERGDPIGLARALAGRTPRWALVAAEDLSAPLAEVGRAPREVVRIPKRTFCRYVHVGPRAEDFSPRTARPGTR